jgi:hypothetical protein
MAADKCISSDIYLRMKVKENEVVYKIAKKTMEFRKYRDV